MTQKSFLTLEALRFSLRRNTLLVNMNSFIRIAAFAQPVPHKGSWEMVRLNWNTEPTRRDSFIPKRTPCNCN